LTRLLDRGPASPVRSLYVHVPFCTDRCTYCAFATIANDTRLHRALVDALLGELDLRAVRPQVLETVYLGGGTPGLLDGGDLAHLLEGLRARVPFAADAEISLEINPANVSPSRLEAWHDLGITRLSMGVQTFVDATLRELGRHHDGNDARRALELVSGSWAGSWSADLLVGWAGQSPSDLEADVRELVDRGAPHVSVYGLTLEPGTPLLKRLHLGHNVITSSIDMETYDDLWSTQLLANGYERYEVSNFARPGARSRHNQMYWRNGDYLGLGPGAATSAHPLRWSNIRSTRSYLDLRTAGRSVRSHVERLTPDERLLETLGVGLRARDGIAVAELDRRFGIGWRERLASGLEELRAAGALADDDARLRLPDDVLTRADSVAVMLARHLGAASGVPSG